MIVNTGRIYGHLKDPRAVAIVISMPRNVVCNRLQVTKLAPTKELHLDSYYGRISKDEYNKRFNALMDERFPDQESLIDLLNNIAEQIGSDELVLCCYEVNPQTCHRSLVYNRLPEDIKGENN